ncbi:hypothetical protein [Sinomonas sp. P47F7]|uniref:hypothetical protein n=1 Tax=Sinomonas sp. P47F7 TaxID=3410987 RepID=UPI003BF5883E
MGSPLAVKPSKARTLPATASDLGLGDQQTKTLVLRTTPQGGFTAALMRGSGTTLDSLSAAASASRVTGVKGSEAIAADDAAQASLRRAVAVVSTSTGVDPRQDLDALGVGFVVLQQRDGGDAVTASQMDAVPGLVAVGQTDVGWLWRVTPRNQDAAKALEIAHRASIVDAKGAVLGYVGSGAETVDASIPAGPEGRLLVLAERSDPHWSAWINGQRLTSTTQGWSQAFTLPAGGGRLEIRYDQPAALPLGLVTAVVLLIAALTAIPTRARLEPRKGRGRSAARRGPAKAPGRAPSGAARPSGLPERPERAPRVGPDGVRSTRGADKNAAGKAAATETARSTDDARV